MIRSTALIFLCFLLTSTGYLAWLYHLMGLVPANTSDILTMVMGYSLQALGIGIFALLNRTAAALTNRHVFAVILIALRGEPVSTIIFWALGYFTFGFYSVYRVILFSDISQQRNMLYLSGFGLFIGRIGDAAGKGVCIVLEKYLLALIVSAAVLFVVSVFFFFRLYQKFYVTAENSGKSEREIFNSFASRHDLSAREREVRRLLLEEKSNSEIAESLIVSDSTVKYHIHNLLKKTGCKNRLELITRYHSS